MAMFVPPVVLAGTVTDETTASGLTTTIGNVLRFICGVPGYSKTVLVALSFWTASSLPWMVQWEKNYKSPLRN